MTYPDAFLKDILNRTKVVAVVGVSTNPVRPSYYVARYLGLKGYTVIPVNPVYAGGQLKMSSFFRTESSLIKDKNKGYKVNIR